MRPSVLPVFLLIARLTLPASAGDWNQAAGNPQRTAHVADGPAGPYKVEWFRRWGDEVLFNTCQPIMVGGRLFVGTQNGVVHAVAVETGADVWNTDVGAPICHALASDGQRVYVAAFNGTVYALRFEDGKEVWHKKVTRRGFSAAPLLMNGRVFVGNRDGVFYAFQANTGDLLWSRDTGDPIVQTAAGAGDRVVFVNDALWSFCLDARDGTVRWETKPLPGSSVRDYWPVIHKGRVVIRTAVAGPRALGGKVAPLQKKFFWPVLYNKPPDTILRKAKTVDDILAEREIIAEFYRENPAIRTCTVLNLSDGTMPYTADLMSTCRNSGPPAPPALAGDGHLYTTFRTSATDRGFFDISRCGLGRFDLERGRISRPLLCGGPEGLSDVIGVRAPFELTSDETVTLSSGGNWIFGIRCDETPGAVNVKTRQTFRIENVALPRASDLQPGGNVVAVSGKYLAYTKQSHVICVRGR